jgi:hypothetical protein
MANDAGRLNKTGKVFTVAELAGEYGFKDIDGKMPRPLTLKDV